MFMMAKSSKWMLLKSWLLEAWKKGKYNENTDGRGNEGRMKQGREIKKEYSTNLEVNHIWWGARADRSDSQNQNKKIQEKKGGNV